MGQAETKAAEEALARVPGVRIDNQADGERVHISIRGQGVLTESGIRGIKVLSLHHDISTVTGEEVVLFTLAESLDLRDPKKK